MEPSRRPGTGRPDREYLLLYAVVVLSLVMLYFLSTVVDDTTIVHIVAWLSQLL